MIEFMVIGLPRSRTTWMSNWLTTTGTFCLHDSLSQYTLSELNQYTCKKTFGVSDTAIYQAMKGSINSHPAKKLIIHRPIDEINASLGRHQVSQSDADALHDIKGMHVDFKDINRMGKRIWMHLIGDGFDSERFNELTLMNVQPHFDGLQPMNQAKIQSWLSGN